MTCPYPRPENQYPMAYPVLPILTPNKNGMVIQFFTTIFLTRGMDVQLDPDRFLCDFYFKAMNRSNVDTTTSQSVAIFNTDKILCHGITNLEFY